MKYYLVGLNFEEYIEAETEEEAVEKFSDMYDISERYLCVLGEEEMEEEE